MLAASYPCPTSEPIIVTTSIPSLSSTQQSPSSTEGSSNGSGAPAASGSQIGLIVAVAVLVVMVMILAVFSVVVVVVVLKLKHTTRRGISNPAYGKTMTNTVTL